MRSAISDYQGAYTYIRTSIKREDIRVIAAAAACCWEAANVFVLQQLLRPFKCLYNVHLQGKQR